MCERIKKVTVLKQLKTLSKQKVRERRSHVFPPHYTLRETPASSVVHDLYPLRGWHLQSAKLVCHVYGVKLTFQVCCSFSKCNISEPSPSPNWFWALVQSTTSNTITLDVRPCVVGGGHASMIRYAWAQKPCAFKQCSVYNAAGLPAPPFVATVRMH